MSKRSTVDAFLSRALTRAKLGHKYLDAQLYWVTLRTVCNQDEAPVESYELRDDTAGPDVYVDVDEALTAAIVLDWAQTKGLLNDDDRRALDVRFGGKTVLPVREVAARLEVSENGLKSRLRRAMGRIRGGVAEDAEELTQVCVAALWPAETAESRGGQRGESSLIA